MSTRSFECIMDQIINNQLNLSPSGGSPPRSDCPFFFCPLWRCDTNPEWMFCVFFQAAGDLLKEHSNRPVYPVKIGLASVKPTRRHRYNTHTLHFIDYAPKPPQSPALQVMSSPLRLARSPYSPHFHPLAQILSHLPATPSIF